MKETWRESTIGACPPAGMPGGVGRPHRVVQYLAWVGVFVFGALAGCGTDREDVSVTADSAAEVEVSPADAVEKEAANETAEGRLLWYPEPAPHVGRTLDLCETDDAVLAGLDGGDLENDRRSLGLDCSAGTGLRYAFVGSGGDVALGESVEDAKAAAGELSNPSIATDGVDHEASPAPSLGTPLGFYGGEHDAQSELDGSTKMAVLPDSLTLIEGTIRGLAVNSTRGVHFTRVVVEIGDARSEPFPLTVQPGEIIPFVIAGAALAEPLEAAEMRVTGEVASGVDRSRSVLITGSPGFWSGAADDFPEAPRELVGTPTQKHVDYFGTELVAAEAGSHPGVSPRGLPRADFEVIVALLDDKGRVLDVIRPKVKFYEGKILNSGTDGIGFTGFLLSPEAADFMMWTGIQK